CGKDCIADRRRDRRDAGLAHPARWRTALDDVDMSFGGDVGTSDQVVAKITLLDAPLLDADVAVERIADAHDHGALELRAHAIWIDDEAAIDPDIHSWNGELPVGANGDLHDRRRVAEETAVDSNAASMPRRQPAAPFAAACDQVENTTQA